MDIKLESTWKELLVDEFNKPYFHSLTSFVKKEYKDGKIFPPGKLIFNALDSLPVDKVRVVILGQDPYHGDGQAHGLSFSVPDGVAIPPSLKNIFKELHDDLGVSKNNSGDLTSWVSQGVLLLNSTLTVRAHQAGSHQKQGWETFTDAIIKKLSDSQGNLVFILWGNYAQKKSELIDQHKHLIIRSAHPSPLSAYNGFFGSKPFSKTNSYLESHGKTKIYW